MKDFDYIECKTIDEASSFLAKHNGKAKILAGGTDLLVEMKEKILIPQYVVNIKGIADMDHISYDKNGGVNHREFGDHVCNRDLAGSEREVWHTGTSSS